MLSFGNSLMNKAWLCIVLMCLQCPVHADEVLWKSGMNLFIKLDKQDKNHEGQLVPNQHPVSLDPREIRDSLNALLVWDKSFFTGALKDKEEAESVFSLSQARLLGTHIASGLAKARPDQDIVFAITRRKKSFLFMKDTVYTGGRAFYANGKLNVIIGDYDRLGDKFKERAHQSSGISEIKYYIAPGKRKKKSGFDKGVILIDGVKTQQLNGKNRNDWFVIDVGRASAAYIAKKSGEEAAITPVNDAKLRREAEKSARERREMRLEMARMRKEMQQSQSSAGSLSVEERLQKLDSLREKELVTEEEYKAKRAEILSEL